MKTAIIIADVGKQVVFVPENKTDKQALKMFSPSDDITLVVKEGMFCNREITYGYNIDFCKSGYLRPFDNSDALMLVLTPKTTPEPSNIDKFKFELILDLPVKDLPEAKQKELTEFIENYIPRR